MKENLILPGVSKIGRYAMCHRCQSVDVPVFRRDTFGMDRVELCRKCITDLDLDWPIGAFDQPEPDPEPTPPALSSRDLVVFVLFLALAVVFGIATGQIAASLMTRLAGN